MSPSASLFGPCELYMDLLCTFSQHVCVEKIKTLTCGVMVYTSDFLLSECQQC